MKTNEQKYFDAKRFQYLQRGENNNNNNKVDIFDLNMRLNKMKKSNLYTNVKIITFSISCLIIISAITLKF
jgi:hypothetical protein